MLPPATAQRAAQPCRARLVAAARLDVVQQRQPEMHGQAHALHLFQVGDKALAAVHRHVHIDLVQRLAPQPGHEIIKRCLDLDPGHPGADGLGCGFQQGYADDTAGPVALDLGDELFGAVAGRHKAHKALRPAAVLQFQQELLQQPMGDGHEHHVHNGDHDRKIAGVQQRGFRQQQAGRIDDAEHDVEFQRQDDFVALGAGHDVLILVKAQKRQHKGQQQQAKRLDPVKSCVILQLVEHVIRDKPCQHNADARGHKIGEKHIRIL